MQVQVNTDHNVDGREELVRWVEAELTTGLARFEDRLTRVEVHLSDESAGRDSRADKRCMIEARAAGRPPVAVTNHAETFDDAIAGAVGKMDTLLSTTFERADDRKGGASVRGRGRD